MRYSPSVSREDQDQLISRAQDGDVRAFEQLLAGHLPRIRRYARAFASSEPDADDLAQDALVRIYRNLRSFRYQSSFSTWLYALVRNVFLDSGKGRAGRRRTLEEPLEAHHQEHGGGARPDDEALAEEERRRVWAAIRQLPAEFRSALVLFDIEGCTYDEVAAIEGIAIGTVKSRLHRARGLLRELLGEASPVAGDDLDGAGRDPGTPEGSVSSNASRRS
jgi:RNA polymerase sigma-70 factor (ECF subfamily)